MSSQTTEGVDNRPRIQPHPGPQTAFLTTPADIAIYGGEYGGGKTWALWYDPLRWVEDYPGFDGILFRRQAVDLTGPESLWDQSYETYQDFGAKSREGSQYRDRRFPSGAKIVFAHLQLEKDKYDHKGPRYAYIGFDQLEQFTETQFWYLYSRAGSKCGVKPYVRATCNPDPDSFVRKLIDWWIGEDGFAIDERCGILRWFIREGDELVFADSPEELKERFPHNEMGPKSLTFIHARLEDNPTLNEGDPEYKDRILAMTTVERERGRGNWNIRPAAGQYFQRGWVEIVDAPPHALLKTARGWDLAASEVSSKNPDPAWTAGVKIGKMVNNRFIVLDMLKLRGSPAEVQETIKNTAITDGASCHIAMWQDPGQAGKEQALFYSRAMRGYTIRFEVASKDKITYASPFSAMCQNGSKFGEPVLVLKGDWNEAFFTEWESFPEGKKKDIVDATSRAHMELTRGAGKPTVKAAGTSITRELIGGTEGRTKGGRMRW